MPHQEYRGSSKAPCQQPGAMQLAAEAYVVAMAATLNAAVCCSSQAAADLFPLPLGGWLQKAMSLSSTSESVSVHVPVLMHC
jgi:hypothetical protein